MKNLDAWLDALESKQEQLSRELQETEKHAKALAASLGPDAGPLDTAKKQIKNNPNLNKHFQELEKAADADGRRRADAAKRDLDDLRGDKKTPIGNSGRGRPGAVRI
jgi:septal ring factor EnvC (AmiA/AmiB activator)